jgi:hypothetical protein
MTDKRIQAEHGQSNMEKDPADWITGDEPMTGAQKSYLKTLCEEARQPFDESLSKAQASRRIDELQAQTGRGAQGGHRAAASGADGDGQQPEPAGESAAASLGKAVASPVIDAPKR